MICSVFFLALVAAADAKISAGGSQLAPSHDHAGSLRFRSHIHVGAGCVVPLLPEVGNKGYDTKAEAKCKELETIEKAKVCNIKVKENFECTSPGKCNDPKFQEQAIACKGKGVAKEIKIENVALKDGKLAGSTVTGKLEMEGGVSKSFTVTLDNDWFACTAYARTTEKVNGYVKAEAKAAATTKDITAQADFFAELEAKLAGTYGLKFNGLEVKVTLTANAQTSFKASASWKGIEANAKIGVAVEATGEMQMKYFGAKGQVKAGAYAEAGVVCKFDDNWNLNVAASAGCFFGASFNIKLGIGALFKDVARGVKKGMSTMYNAFSSENKLATDGPFKCKATSDAVCDKAKPNN